MFFFETDETVFNIALPAMPLDVAPENFVCTLTFNALLSETTVPETTLPETTLPETTQP